MDLDKLFLRTLGQLEYLLRVGDDYAVIRASALIRQLLLDDYPLADQVNRNHKLKILYPLRFRKAMVQAEKEHPDSSFMGLGYEPGCPPVPPEHMEYVSRDVFMSNRAFMIKRRRVSTLSIMPLT